MDSTIVAKVLDELAERLSGPAEKVWEIFVKQAIADGVGSLVIAVIGVIIIFSVIKLLPKISERLNEYSYEECDEDVWIVLLLLLCGIGLASIFVVPTELISGIKHLINPEYYALMDIISNIPGTK